MITTMKLIMKGLNLLLWTCLGLTVATLVSGGVCVLAVMGVEVVIDVFKVHDPFLNPGLVHHRGMEFLIRFLSAMLIPPLVLVTFFVCLRVVWLARMEMLQGRQLEDRS